MASGKIPADIMRRATEETLELTATEASHVGKSANTYCQFDINVLRDSLQVAAMLKSSLEKLALVGVITVDPKLQAQELTQSVGEEITRMIAEQKDLERRFEELVSAQHILRTLPNKAKLRDNQVNAVGGALH